MNLLNFSTMVCMLINCSFGQTPGFNLSGVDLYNLDGIRISASDLAEPDKPVVMLFWKFNDRNSIDQLNELNDAYLDLIKDRNIKVIGICTDVNGAELSVKSLINGMGIEFEIYIDRNNDLKRAMEISIFPHSFLFEKFPGQYSSYIGYCPDIAELIRLWMVS